MNRRFLALALVLALFAAAPVTDAWATSVYSMFLIGEAIESGEVRSISIGGSTQILDDSLGVVHLNPALLSRIPRVTIGATQYLAIDEGRNSEYAERDVSFTFSSFRAVFPVARLLRFAVGYTGRYEPGSGFTITGETEGGNPYRQKFEKSGGLYSVPLTVAFDLSRFVSIGLTYSFERGTIENQWIVTFDEPGFAPGAGLQKEDLSGRGLAAGVLLRPFGGIILGGMYEEAIEYDAQIAERYSTSSLDTSYTATLTLPRRVVVGATIPLGGSFIVAASGSLRDFGEIEGQGFSSSGLAEEQSLSLGVEWTRGFRIGGIRFPLRGGFKYEKLPFEYPSGEKVEKYLASIGTGVRVRGGKGKLDIGIQGGRVGSLGSNGIEDRLVRVYLGIAGGEEWKRKGAELF
jgi:hypothetical protein